MTDILMNIFKFFSISFLLSSLSLVNKAWNRDVRRFIRIYRKCVARSPHEPNCERHCRRLPLEVLCKLCREMSEEGRQVPFNGLEVELSENGEGYFGDNCAGAIHTSLPTGVKLKHLVVTGGYDQVQDPIVPLIRDRASEIQYLMTDTARILEDFLLFDDHQRPTNFLNLEEIAVYLKEVESDWAGIFRRMLSRSPKIKKIFIEPHNDMSIPQKHWRLGGYLKFVPKEYWGLAGNLNISVKDVHKLSKKFQILLEKSLN